MSTSKLLPLADDKGFLLTPYTLKLGELGFKESIELAYSFLEIVRRSTPLTVRLVVSRSPNPQRVHHRILVDDVEVYAIRVDMRSRTVSFEGPLTFKTLPGASDNLCDYMYGRPNQSPLALPRSTPPPLEPVAHALGSILQVEEPSGRTWYGQLVEQPDAETLGLRHLWHKLKEDAYNLREPVWMVDSSMVIRGNIAMTEIRRGVWAMTPPAKPLTPPASSEVPLKAGSFVKYKCPDGFSLARLVADKTGDQLLVRKIRLMPTPGVYSLSPNTRTIDASLVVEDHVRMKEVGPGRWKVVTHGLVETPSLRPVGTPRKSVPKKRMETEIQQMQSQAKRLRCMVETLERETVQIANRWNIMLE
jgi:hypothetical protein